MATRPIYQFCEDPFACPECGARLDFGDPVDMDDDGFIYEGACSSGHGPFLVQSVEEEST